MRATRPALLLTLVLVACGGGGGGSTATPPPDSQPGLTDTTVYSSAADASLPGAVEAAAVSAQTLTAGGQTLGYTATAGHLIARDATGAAEASMFYVAYTLPGADVAMRPVTFLYNGGPGSASVWLQLGSFGPKRLVTGVPDTTAARPFAMVDNAEHLLGQTDLVFINAVGTGYSEAIAPFTNRSFWGVDSDAALFRDFIQRYLAANNRAASPKYLYGESYGGPRTAVLARRLQDVGVMLDGLVLQSPALDYNSNCGIGAGQGCSGYLPSLAMVGAFHRLTQPLPTDLAGWANQARNYADQVYAPALQAFITSGTQAPALWQPLADLTGLAASRWQASLNVAADDYRQWLIAGQLLGRYDGRMKAPTGSPLASEGDPSSTWLTDSFATGIATHLRDQLGYRNASTYVLLSDAASAWDFSHAGRSLPDTLPDLAAALAQNARLRVLAVSGYHDLATPFHLTETDLARVDASRVKLRSYAGGHMSYLDDTTRPQQLADLKAFYAGTLALRAAADLGPERRALEARPVIAQDRAGTPQQPGSVAPTHEKAVQAPLRDPWVPPRTMQVR
ncbi:S10 family peptidase [Roseateles saccharophilus]|uniref:Carboxypeptidase C (Cathepsin A) n=1 Tax=Roseateles saccharophilus TaxID=304 RepID=A0A4R3UG61_ROSSA|nr:peptidase S10 [Roseateles saccharophilus]MDG0834495.1 peptidase S10 [Roseateles saccharophilus]TCU89784.1 carboxypeptidase C (cathepsin A) [Roseateles saccharophilus]